MTAEYGDLGGQGFVIDTIDNNVYISGAQDMGTLYGVYEFLSATIDFAVYGPEITDYAKKEEIPLYDIGITDKTYFEEMAVKAARGCEGSFVELTKDDIVEIFNQAF